MHRFYIVCKIAREQRLFFPVHKPENLSNRVKLQKLQFSSPFLLSGLQIFLNYFKELSFKAPPSQLQLECIRELKFGCFLSCFFVSGFWVVLKYCVCFWLCFLCLVPVYSTGFLLFWLINISHFLSSSKCAVTVTCMWSGGISGRNRVRPAGKWA